MEVDEEEQQEEEEETQEQQEEDGNEGDEEQEDGDVMLEFNEPLSWKAGKAIAVATLIKRLAALSKELQELDQETVNRASLMTATKELAAPNLLGHRDDGVKAYAACCLADMLRLHAPDAPYTGAQLKVYFDKSSIAMDRANMVSRISLTSSSYASEDLLIPMPLTTNNTRTSSTRYLPSNLPFSFPEFPSVNQ